MKKLTALFVVSVIIVGCNKYKNHIDNGVYQLSHVKNQFGEYDVDPQSNPSATGPMGNRATFFEDSVKICSNNGVTCSTVAYTIKNRTITLPSWELRLLDADESSFVVGYEEGEYTYQKQ